MDDEARMADKRWLRFFLFTVALVVALFGLVYLAEAQSTGSASGLTSVVVRPREFKGTGRISTISTITESSPFLPTVTGTGFGTGPTIVAGNGSSDFAGLATITTGTTPAALGTLTVTFSTASAYGQNNPACVAMLGDNAGLWNVRATIIGSTLSTTAAVFKWDNNAVTLTASTTYRIAWVCVGK
jgi:hypothetical protein